MSDREKRAHDLAILYMQLEIKEGKISIPIQEDCESFTNEYKHLYNQFIRHLENL